MNSNVSRRDFINLSAKTFVGALLFGSSSALFSNLVQPQKAYASPNSFIMTICEEARDIGHEYNIHASVMLAQALIESASGTSGLSTPPNYNLFGIKGQGTAGSVNMQTAEDDGEGNYYTINSAFRKYNSWQESMKDYADLIRGNNAFRGAWLENTEGNYHKATSALQGNYATSTSYASTLDATISNYDLAQYDQKRNYNIDGVWLSRIISFSRLNTGKYYESSLGFILESFNEAYSIELDEKLTQFKEIDSEEYRISDVIVDDQGNYGVYLGAGFIAIAKGKLVITSINTIQLVKHYRYKECLSDEERYAIYLENLEKEIKEKLDKELEEKDKTISNEIKSLYDFD